MSCVSVAGGAAAPADAAGGARAGAEGAEGGGAEPSRARRRRWGLFPCGISCSPTLNITQDFMRIR